MTDAHTQAYSFIQVHTVHTHLTHQQHTTECLAFLISKSVSTTFVSYNNSGGAPRGFTGHIYHWLYIYTRAGGDILPLSADRFQNVCLCVFVNCFFFLYYAGAFVLCACMCLHVWFPSLLQSLVLPLRMSACFGT